MKFKTRSDKEIDISEEDFKAYEEVRESGVTNMLMVSTVSDLSGLSVEKVKAIISNYEALTEEFPNVREIKNV